MPAPFAMPRSGLALLCGPGRCVCRWAAARPRDRHTRACGSEWSISRPALALPPPTGTAARPRRPRVPRPGPAAAHGCRGQALPPPTGAAAWLSGPSGALHAGGAVSLACGWVRRLEARPGPAATLRHRGQAPPPTGAAAWPSCALRRPPHQWRLVADVWLGALTRCPARLRHSPWASQISRVKPVSPLLAQGEPQMKPPSPLRVRNGCFGSVFRLQW